MNARLTSIGFYLTCIIFFGFQSKSNIHANNSLPAITNNGLKKTVQSTVEPVKVGEAVTENKTIKNSIGYKPVNER